MKYPCKLIQDLLPLYLDEVCSEESKTAIENHLSECAVCKEFYHAMCEAEGITIESHDAQHEQKKAASFQTVKKKLFRKQLMSALLAVISLVVVSIIAVSILKNTIEVVEYNDNISVSMVDSDLVGRLQGSQQTHVKIKRVTVTLNGQEENYLFFCVSDTKWDDLTTSSKVFSEYTLCPSNKGADDIDAVYYFTKEYTDIETLSNEELQEVINNSILLWSKE